MIRLIAAIDSQRGIATESGIPWKLPGDTAYFREKTAHGLIVMGRATYDEFAAPLHGGENYVLSTTATPLRTGFQAIADLPQLRAAHPDEDIWVIGGATVYRETVAEAEELLLTQVLKDFHCAKFFPPYEAAFELETRSVDHQEAGLTYRFETWQSRKADAGASSQSSSKDVLSG
jgi:dihydrofolate reductase